MNRYQQILVDEYGEGYAAAMLKWARQAIQASETPRQRHTTRQQQLVASWETSCGYYSKEDFRPCALALTAVKATEFKDEATVNLDQVTGGLFERKHFRCLQEEGLIEIFAVAPPYQFVFLL